MTKNLLHLKSSGVNPNHIVFYLFTKDCPSDAVADRRPTLALTMFNNARFVFKDDEAEALYSALVTNTELNLAPVSTHAVSLEEKPDDNN